MGDSSLGRRRGRGASGAAVAALLLAAVSGACEPAPADRSPLLQVTALPSPAGSGSAEPNLAAGPDGRVYLSWLEPAGEGHALRFAVLQEGGWSPVRTIAEGEDWFVNWADFPSLMALPSGRLAAHYLQQHSAAEKGYHYDVRIVQSADGGATWSAPVLPHRDGVPAEHGFVSLFAAAGDSLGAVWLDGRKSHAAYGATGEMTLRSTTIAPDGSLGAEVVIDERICDCCQTSLALAASGPVVVYRDRSEAEIRDIYVTRLVDGRWTEGRPVHRDGWEINACPVNGPAVAARGERVAVAWFTAARDSARVLLAFSDDSGETFGAPVRIDAGDPAGRVDVELLPDGGAVVSWIERVGGEAAEVRLRHVSRDGAAAEPQTLATSSGSRASGFPRMVLAGNRVVFAWTEPGDVSQVRVAHATLAGENDDTGDR